MSDGSWWISAPPERCWPSWVGGGLSLSGAVFQALLRNPLAEPYILGISGGAATGAVLALAMGLAASLSWALPAAAFAGALFAIVLVLRVAATADDGVDVRVLLLAGVVVGAFFTACMSFVLSISDGTNGAERGPLDDGQSRELRLAHCVDGHPVHPSRGDRARGSCTSAEPLGDRRGDRGPISEPTWSASNASRTSWRRS